MTSANEHELGTECAPIGVPCVALVVAYGLEREDGATVKAVALAELDRRRGAPDEQKGDEYDDGFHV